MWYNLYIRVYKLNLVLLRVNIYPLSYKGKAFMRQITKADYGTTDHQEYDFNWARNPSVQKLSDVVAYILANECVRAVMENTTLFEGKTTLPR